MAQEKNITPEALADAKVSQEDLLALVDTQGALIAEQQAEIAKLKSEVSALQAAKPAAKGPVAAEGTFKVAGKEYRVVHGLLIRRDGALVKVSAQEILGDKELREHLVKNRSNAVQSV